MPKGILPIITTVLFFCCPSLSAQENNPVKDLIESLGENFGEDYDLSELTEKLQLYLHRPIDLNNTSGAQLQELIFLSPLQINNLLTHISKAGRLKDVLELQGIDGFDLQTISRLLPFVVARQPSDLKNIADGQLYQKGTHDLILRYGRILQTQKGFRDLPGSRYLGTPGKALLRYRYNYDDAVSVALVAEKDAGEFWLRNKITADHLSFHIALKGKGHLSKLVLGDYSLQFGQGLSLWSGFAFGKGPDVTSVASKDLGLRTYSSSNEASFFRGLAGTVKLAPSISVTPFVSYRKLDASLKFDADSNISLQNISISGLHRTPAELKNQTSLGQLVYGAAITHSAENLSLGAVVCQSEYQHAFVTGTQLYNKYGFSGSRLSNTGFHYTYTYENIYFYGETAHSVNGGWAILNGALTSLSSVLSAVLLHRNYDKDYHNFFSNGLGEATGVNNEKGLYLGLNYSPFKKWTFSAYGDYFKFPWLKYRVDAPSSGYEMLTQIAYVPSKNFKSLLRYKREIKQQNPDDPDTRDRLDKVNKQNLRLDWAWQPGKMVSFHQRFELSSYQKGTFLQTGSGKETGYILIQDADFKPYSGRLSGNLRLAYFSTPSYNTRVYAYEDDVLYGAGSAIYYGKGFRSYVNIKCRMAKRLDCWMRYAVYCYFHKEAIGSGLDEITGNKKSDLKFQLRYQF